jgi:hypothetical protein
VVEVTYGSADEQAALVPPPPAARQAGPPGWVTAGLVVLFGVGLAGSIWASRRKTAIGPQEPWTSADS